MSDATNNVEGQDAVVGGGLASGTVAAATLTQSSTRESTGRWAEGTLGATLMRRSCLGSIVARLTRITT